MSYTTTMNIIIRSLPLQTDGNCAVQHKTNRVLRGLFCLLLFMGAMSAKAQITAIPDANFEQALIEQEIDTDGEVNGQVFMADIENVTSLDLSFQGIADLTGIEDFVALNELNCDNNQIVLLDLSNNLFLSELQCHNNLLQVLNISACAQLEMLNAYSNQLTTLIVDNHPALDWFNVTNNPNLICIQVADEDAATNNQDQYANWQKDVEASYSEDCHYGQTYVPDDNFELALQQLNYEEEGPLDDYILTASIQNIINLDLSNNFGNIFDMTGIEDFTALQILGLGGEAMTDLDLSNNTELIILNAESSNLVNLNISGLIHLQKLVLSDIGNSFTNLDVSSNVALSFLSVWGNGLTSLNVINNPLLENLDCSHNPLNNNLSLGVNESLRHLNVENTQITELDVSQLPNLEYLKCGENNLEELDVSDLPNLLFLWANNNQLSSLDLSHNPTLGSVEGLELDGDECLNVTSNPNLSCIQLVDQNAADQANNGQGIYAPWSKDNQASYSEDCSENQQGDLIAAYNFDVCEGTTLIDNIANLDGSVSGGTWTAGYTGQALNFDGLDDYAEIPDDESVNFGSGDFTVAFWVKKLSETNEFKNNAGVAKWNNGGQAGTNEWALYIGKGESTDYPHFVLESGNTKYDAISNVELVIGEWTHLVGVRDGGEVRLYQDGILVATTAIGNQGINDTDLPVYIGRIQDGFYSNAIYDEIKIYNKALLVQEIGELAGLQQNPIECQQEEGELIAAYNFDACEGTTLIDNIANLDGSVSGGTWTAGYTGQALSFDGLDDYAEIPDDESVNFGSGDFTVAFWVKKLSETNEFKNNAGIAKWNNGGQAGTNEWALHIGKGESTDYPHFVLESGNTKYDAISNVELIIGEWTHLVGVRDDGEVRLYQDGILVATTAIGNQGVNDTDLPVYIGRIQDGFYSNAIYDEIKIYNKALLVQEIGELADLQQNPIKCVGYDLTIQAENVPDELAINVQYKVEVTVPEDQYNQNVEAAIGIYLSIDNQYDVGDQLLISGPIMTNTPTDFIFVIEQALLSGNYHLIFRADIDDAYDETNETNNQQVFARYLNAKSDIDETCLNYISTYTYGQDNTQIGSARSYFDFSGKPIQTQGKSFATGLITISEPLYDRFGRSVGQTMGAPMNINEHVYYPNFMVNEEGDKYDYTDFDENNVLSPNAVGSQNGTLGGYYSESNVLEPYTPITSYPYSRMDFYGDGSGEARRSAGAGDEMHMGSGKETLGGTFPITDELDHYKSIRDLFFPDNTNYSYNKRGYQTVVEDVNDRFHISCFDKTGNLLMSAMEGDWMTLQMYVSYFENPQRYFYLIEDQDVSVNFWNNSTLQNIVTNEIIAIDQSGDLALTKGYYRFFADAVDLGSGQITLENSLGDISYNIYDDAGRLVASIAPNGVKELIDNDVEDYEWDQLPFTTYYTYNHQGWLLSTTETDAGRSEFIYRKDGSIRYSQNALQRTSGHFSYTEYDKLGRPIESGEYPDAGWDFGGDNMIENLEAVGNVSNMWEDNRKDWVRTHYDFADPELSGKPFNDGTYGQDFMQGGVSWTENDKVKTWYSYDELGRTAWTAQEQSTWVSSEKIKYLAVHYTYDYPGNVTKTGFEVFDDEGNLQDEGYHYYTYDADQRLHQAYFSTWDNITDLENDPHALLQATYTYYLHGPLKRVELGEDIQGIDYTYTLSGQLKSINHPHQANDPGKDDNDVFGMLLEYYENDYLSRAQPENYRNDDEGLVAQYNGNIAAMSWRSNDVFGMANSAAKGTYVYDYDNKSQLLQAQLATPTFTGANYAYAFANDNPGKVVIQGYDPNGNITGLVRNGQGGPVEHDFTYNYIAGTNQLQNIPDHVGLYEYDEIGQLVHEQGESGSDKNMRYDVTGNVTMVFNENNKVIARYEYDERGFRIHKLSEILDNTTWYMRDVSGNILMTYTKEGFNDPEPYEIPLYGAGRIGTYYANDFGATDYEVSDHLGNVRALVKNDKNGYLATMEPANKNTEDALFNNYLATKEPHTGINHTTGDGAAYISLLNEAQRVGPAKVLQVNPGDKVEMETYVKYLALEGAMSDGGSIGNLFDQVSTAFGGLDGGTEDEQAIYDLFNANFAGTLAVSPGNGDFDDEPRAYLNYLFFSENGTFIPENSGYTGMTSNAKIPWIDGIPEAGEIPHEKLAQTLDIEQPGYLYIYIANESNEAGVEVYFDDLMVMHNTTMLAQTTDYYPFGSELRTAKTNVDKQYRFGYQGQFAEKDEETGWNHFELRNFDPVVGRWMSTDPYGQYWSPYIGMGNNPVNLVDPDGGCADCPPKLKSLGFEPLVGADPNFGDMLYNNGLMPTRRLYPITIISPAGDKEKFLFRQKIYKAQGEFLAGSRPYIIMGAHILAGPGGWASYGKSLAFGYIKSGGDLQGSVEGVDAMGLLFGQIKSSGLKNLLNNFIDYNGKEGFGVKSFSLVEGEGGNITLQVDSGELYYNILKSGVHTGIDKLTKTQMEYLGPAPKYTNDIFKRMFGSEGFPE